MENIRYCCLIMSCGYIENHFGDIKNHASAIEKRLDDSKLDAEALIRDNEQNLAACVEYGCAYVLIDDTYSADLEDVVNFV